MLIVVLKGDRTHALYYNIDMSTAVDIPVVFIVDSIGGYDAELYVQPIDILFKMSMVQPNTFLFTYHLFARTGRSPRKVRGAFLQPAIPSFLIIKTLIRILQCQH